MIIRFMGGTSYAELERMMQSVPGFQSRCSGVVVSRAADGDGGIKGSEAACTPISRLLEQLAEEVAEKPFTARVARLSRQVSGRSALFFFLVGHRGRFDNLWRRRGDDRDEAATCAALYLLSADHFLWGRSVAVIQPDRIRFKEIPIQGVDLGGYVLFHAAKDLYQGTRHISLAELTDPELIDDDIFRLVIASFLIRRYGAGILTAERS